MKKTETKKVENRKAHFDYTFIEEFVSGIVLHGCEIKSIRNGNVSINESYCYVKDNEVFIKNMHISVYDKSNDKIDPLRERKLLLTKKEIRKLKKGVSENGMAIVPTFLYINDKGIAKLKIVLAKGKHTYDKRQSIKERDIDRQAKREY